MSYQKYLQKIGRQFPHASNLRSTCTGLVVIIIYYLFFISTAAATTIPSFQRIEAARSNWDASSPPDAGWTAVTLPDDWSLRWPGFDGVVWYRLTWNQPGKLASGDTEGLLLDYLNMAGAVYLNGIQLSRDPNLVEPLTRAWNTSRYWVVSAPVLKAGENILLIRVSGLAAYQPGLGPVALGSASQINLRYMHEQWLRHDMHLLSLAVTATLGCFFLALWLFRRRETEFGWFGLMSLAWWIYVFNQVATTTWPFASTDTWEAVSSIAFLLHSACFTMFVLRSGERRFRRTEFLFWIMVLVQAIAMLLTPHARMQEMRNLLALIPGLTYLASCFLFLYFAWRDGRTDQYILSVCIAFFIVVGIHDFLVFTKVLNSNIYYSALASQIQMAGMALILGWRFVANLRRIERFNDELYLKVEAAKDELAVNLQHQHKLEIANAQLGERINLAHDLHDGLGGTLVTSIATLEHAPESIPSSRFLSILKELRDDLRIIIDAASSYQLAETSLAEMLSPLRHRLSVLFESQHIACHWQLSGIENIHLPTARSMDVMRILQEGLTNVLKHSHADSVHIELSDDAGQLTLVIKDNGVGFDPVVSAPQGGTGMRSMRGRASRLGGTFETQRINGETILTITIPGAGTGQRNQAQDRYEQA